MELDVSAPALAWCAWSPRAQVVRKALEGRVINGYTGFLQPDVELVIDTRFARVSGLKDKVDVTKQVRPGCAANLAGAD